MLHGKKIIFLLILASLSSLAFGQVKGNYYGSTGKGHCKIKINRDYSYEQEVTDCLYGFITKGTCKMAGDTLVLLPVKTLNRGQRKNTIVADTSHISLRLTKYMVKQDSLIQLKKYGSAYHRTWALEKVKPKK